ncbi:MAG: hypothetical protein FWB96_10025 [Defluviitaleaceae bacterium]|nr:hypothetical protein [Defluviitaleaceae bacterium]MCL2263208.1 hypothetical protein [Defluviitaleaceae bacterium]
MRSIRCKRCGRMFDYEGLPPPCCPICKKERDEQFHMVRDIVSACPGITALEVSKSADVPLELIMRFVELGMLDVVPTSNEKGNIIPQERDGAFVKRAKEIREMYRKKSDDTAAEGAGVDSIGPADDGEKTKFTWHK